ncbi:MAG: 4,5-DOPA dioxygenase extradiol [Saprospiraceae bacterium]|nr:4,5-DOPA dioxygenase extradiol [Saprospiraceae bacterium]
MKRRNFSKILTSSTLVFNMNSLNQLDKYAQELASTDRMPVLFLGHGSPMNAIEENEFVDGFRALAKTLPHPKAILCVSAHWYTRGSKVTAMENPPTIHDFGGFPRALFEVQYPAPGSPELAQETKDLLDPVMVELDETWGLDHGAWSVIKHLYPKADVPVIELSIDYTKPAAWHYQLAQQLRHLRDKGILIIGSGNIIHNLRMVDFANFNRDNYGYDWAIEAREILNGWLLDGNYEALLIDRPEEQSLRLAIPTPDHYLPLVYSLGLQQKGEEISLFNDKLLAGSLSMTSAKIS